MLELRDYQRACLETVRARYAAGVTRQLVCLPTGTGKTVIFAGFPEFFHMKRRMLVLAHREELLEQARDKILRASPSLTVEIEQGSRRASPDARVVVASVPTLGREGSRRLEAFDRDEFYLFVVDEAHHAVSETYLRTLRHFGLFEPGSRKLLVGFTATPRRGDKQGLSDVFQEIVFARGLAEMIRARHLVPLAGWRVITTVDLSRVKTRHGDYVTSELSAAVNVGPRNEIVVDVHRKHLAGRKVICFCVDVAHAKTLAAAFRERGVRAEAISGEMPRDQRRETLDRFRAGETEVLTNCMVLTEGFDEPSASGVLLARPTRSTLLYTQMVGRVTRLHPGKTEAVVVDVVDGTKDHALVTLPSLFGLRDDFDLEGRTIEAAEDALRWTAERRPWVSAEDATSISDLRWRCERVNLVDLEMPKELRPISDLAWFRHGSAHYRLLLGDASVEVTRSILGRWEAVHSGTGETIATHPDLDRIVQRADAWVQKHHADLLKLVSRRGSWRADPMTEKQHDLLARHKVQMPPEGLTKGQASLLISMLKARRTA